MSRNMKASHCRRTTSVLIACVHGPDFPGETFRVLKEKEEKQYGEYGTRRPILEACGGFDN